jgi:hypothetical protein
MLLLLGKRFRRTEQQIDGHDFIGPIIGVDVPGIKFVAPPDGITTPVHLWGGVRAGASIVDVADGSTYHVVLVC